MELYQASHQWATRPDDEKYLSLDAMFDEANNQRDHSLAKVVSSRSIKLQPADDNRGMYVVGPTTSFVPTHHAFNQLAQRVSAPADYLRSLPSPLVADQLNYLYEYKREISDVGLLMYQNGGPAMMRAVTGPNYGRIWNADVLGTLNKHFGNSSQWHVPGEFNQLKPITKQSTTLYMGDRDMWVFLADGQHDVEIKNRRGGQSGRLQRGFFCWNSEVGLRPIGIATFLYDFMCCNHIVWGVEGFTEIRIRHTASAPDRWLEEIMPALETYANSSTKGITEAISAAQAKRLDKVDDFLATRFGARSVGKLQAIHMLEEQRPIETMFDAVTAATALARSIPHIGDRVELEREAGKLLELVAA